MTIRKPNRVTTPQRAMLNGTRTSHASMPRARSRWQPGFTGNQASVPGQEELACPPEGRNPQEQEAEASGAMSNRLIVTAATGYSGRYPTRTTGEAHLYRVTQYYDAWPFETHPASGPEPRAASERKPSGHWSQSGSGSPGPTSTPATSTATAGTGRPSQPSPSS